jgi:hypothetical protein
MAEMTKKERITWNKRIMVATIAMSGVFLGGMVWIFGSFTDYKPPVVPPELKKKLENKKDKVDDATGHFYCADDSWKARKMQAAIDSCGDNTIVPIIVDSKQATAVLPPKGKGKNKQPHPDQGHLLYARACYANRFNRAAEKCQAEKGVKMTMRYCCRGNELGEKVHKNVKVSSPGDCSFHTICMACDVNNWPACQEYLWAEGITVGCASSIGWEDPGHASIGELTEKSDAQQWLDCKAMTAKIAIKQGVNKVIKALKGKGGKRRRK